MGTASKGAVPYSELRAHNLLNMQAVIKAPYSMSEELQQWLLLILTWEAERCTQYESKRALSLRRAKVPPYIQVGSLHVFTSKLPCDHGAVTS